MSTPYDVVADNYDLSFQVVPLRLHAEAFSLLKMIGDPTGLSVLDVACGTGFYSRALRQRGAARVLGSDISPEMIRIAQRAEEVTQLGIEYHVGNACELGTLGSFALVLGIHLLHYAPTRVALEAMCSQIAHNLKAGGRLVAFVLNPDFTHEVPGYDAYGLHMRVPDPTADGCPIQFSINVPGLTTPEFTIYRWSKATVESALAAAGLRITRWEAPEISPTGLAEYGEAHWRAYRAMPHCVLLDCKKE